MRVLVIDVGGTEIKYAAANTSLDLMGYGKIKTPYETGVEGFLDVLEGIYRKFEGIVSGVSVSLPGLIDDQNGCCISGGSLEYNVGKPLGKLLSERLQVPVYLQNDGRCAVLAEYWKGALKGSSVGVLFALGTAVAGGIIVNGEVLKGPDFSAGEFSYICADYGRWKQADSLAGTACSAVNYVKEVQTALHRLSLRDGKEVFEQVNKGNPTALRLFGNYLRNIVIQLYNLQIILDPDTIAIGGGISRQETLLEALKKDVDCFYEEGYWTQKNPFLHKPRLTVCRFFNEANLIGALYHYLKRENVIEGKLI